MQRRTGTTEPDFGTLFADWFVDEGATIPMSIVNRPLVEVELAFVLRERLVGPGVTAAEVIRATDVVLPAIEIVDTRYEGRGPRSSSTASPTPPCADVWCRGRARVASPRSTCGPSVARSARPSPASATSPSTPPDGVQRRRRRASARSLAISSSPRWRAAAE